MKCRKDNIARLKHVAQKLANKNNKTFVVVDRKGCIDIYAYAIYDGDSDNIIFFARPNNKIY